MRNLFCLYLTVTTAAWGAGLDAIYRIVYPKRVISTDTPVILNHHSSQNPIPTEQGLISLSRIV